MRAKIERGSAGRRGITLIEVFVVLAVVSLFVGFFLVSMAAYDGARASARRAQCANNLKQVALGLANYETVYGALSPARTLNADGRPLHDWRTLVLPHFGDPDVLPVYQSIDLTRIWFDAANHTAGGTRVSAFLCPVSAAARSRDAAAPKTSTSYLAALEPSGCLVPGEPRRVADATDGASSTLVVIEAGDDRAVPWIAPKDADESVLLGLATAELHHSGGTNAAFLDGSVRFLKAATPPKILRALTTIDGGEAIDPDSY